MIGREEDASSSAKKVNVKTLGRVGARVSFSSEATGWSGVTDGGVLIVCGSFSF